MFRRKKHDMEDDKPMLDGLDDLGIPAKPTARPAASGAATSNKAPVLPTRSGDTRPLAELSRRLGETTMPTSTPTTTASTVPMTTTSTSAPTPIATAPTMPAAPVMPRRDSEFRKLTVGREIALSGEITSCDRLVVEGSVEANLQNCREIDIAESGLFKGAATVDEAEIRGRFEGSLTVRKRLLIRATGKITGTIRYGQIEIECGGQLSGDVQAQLQATDSGIEGAAHALPTRSVAEPQMN